MLKRLIAITLCTLLLCSCRASNTQENAETVITATMTNTMATTDIASTPVETITLATPQVSVPSESLNINTAPFESMEYYSFDDGYISSPYIALPYENWLPLEDNEIIKKYFYGIWEGFTWWDNRRNQNDNGYLIIDDSEKSNIQWSFYFNGYFKISEYVIAAVSSDNANGYSLCWINIKNPDVMYCAGTGSRETLEYGWCYPINVANCLSLTKTDLPLNEPKNGFLSRVRLEEMAVQYGIDKNLLITTEYNGYVYTVDRLYPFYLVSEEPERIVIRAKIFTMAGSPPVAINTIEKVNGEWIRTIEEVQTNPEPLNAPFERLSEEEAALWNSIAEQSDKPIAVYDIADYDSDGKLEMFAITNETGEYNIEWGENAYCSFHQTDNTIYYTGDCDLWYASESDNGAELIKEVFNGRFWFGQFGKDRFIFCDWGIASRGNVNFIFGVKNGAWVYSEASECGTHIGFNNKGEIEAYVNAYDMNLNGGGTYSHKPYWLYYDEQARDFREYGAVEITTEQFMQFKNSETAIELIDKGDIYNRDFTIESILYRGNGYIHINYSASPSFGADLYNFAYINVRYKGDEIIEICKDENLPEDEYSYIQAGVYRPAANPEIAIYPDIAELFN